MRATPPLLGATAWPRHDAVALLFPLPRAWFDASPLPEVERATLATAAEERPVRPRIPHGSPDAPLPSAPEGVGPDGLPLLIVSA